MARLSRGSLRRSACARRRFGGRRGRAGGRLAFARDDADLRPATAWRELLNPRALAFELRLQRLVHGREREHDASPSTFDLLRLRDDHAVERLVLVADGGQEGDLDQRPGFPGVLAVPGGPGGSMGCRLGAAGSGVRRAGSSPLVPAGRAGGRRCEAAGWRRRARGLGAGVSAQRCRRFACRDEIPSSGVSWRRWIHFTSVISKCAAAATRSGSRTSARESRSNARMRSSREKRAASALRRRRSPSAAISGSFARGIDAHTSRSRTSRASSRQTIRRSKPASTTVPASVNDAGEVLARDGLRHLELQVAADEAEHGADVGGRHASLVNARIWSSADSASRMLPSADRATSASARVVDLDLLAR